MRDDWDEVLSNIEKRYGLLLRDKLDSLIDNGYINEVNLIIDILLFTWLLEIFMLIWVINEGV